MFKKACLLITVSSFFAMFDDIEALAQSVSSDSDTSELETVTVTARKTSENLQKAPASIVEVSGAQLEAMGVDDPQSLENVLPSAELRLEGPVTQVYIRGIGTRVDQPNFAAASSFLFDGIVIQRYGTSGLVFDLDRVESIAGPQGTLYGGAASGGAINVYSAKPSGNYDGDALVEYGDFDSVHLSVAQNAPVTDDISVRGAINYDRRDAYYSAGINSQNNMQGRFSVLAQPSEDLTILAFYSGALDHGKPITTAASSPLKFPNNPWELPAIGPAGNPINASFTHQDNWSDIVGANIEWKYGDNRFTYIPGFVDFTANYIYFTGYGGNLLHVYDHEVQDSQELRWNRTVSSFDLSAGLYYSDNKINFNDALFRPNSATAFSEVALNTTTQTDTSYAIFSQAVYSFNESLRATLGARASDDGVSAAGLGASSIPFDFQRHQTTPDYKFGIDYDLFPAILLYANVQTGYIRFGYNPDVQPSALVPESRLLALSGGVKSRFLDNRLELNTEIFHYRYSDFQAITVVNATGLSTVLNAQQAIIYGADTSLEAILPFDTRLNAGLLLESAHYDQFSGVGYNYSGNQIQDAPGVNLLAGLRHTEHLASIGDLLGEVDTHYNGGYYGNFNNFISTRQDAFTRTNISLTYTPTGSKWSIAAYVNNVENSVVYNTLSPGATPTTPASGGLEAPRTFGLRLSATW